MIKSKDFRNYVCDDFYCINCGEKSMPLMRGGNKKRGKGHRKNMYCYHCRHTINHIECRDMEEVAKFKADFAAGLYKEEAENELRFEAENPRLSSILC